MQNLSTIERQWQGHEASKSLFPSYPAVDRQRSEPRAGPHQVNHAARTISDQMFAAHPDIVRLTADLKAWQHRAEGLAMRKTDLTAIAEAMARMQKQLDAGADAFRLASIDDALICDLEFPRALANRQSLDVLELRLRAARLAYADLNKSPPEQGEFRERALQAHTDLKNALFRLKREHVLAQPDQLGFSCSKA